MWGGGRTNPRNTTDRGQSAISAGILFYVSIYFGTNVITYALVSTLRTFTVSGRGHAASSAISLSHVPTNSTQAA